MTLPGMADLAATIERRWALEGLLLLHRVGLMVPGDAIKKHRRRCAASARCLRRRRFRDGSPGRAKSWFWKREKTATQLALIGTARAGPRRSRALVIGA
jgi:molybdopterin synthase catalytic subunit